LWRALIVLGAVGCAALPWPQAALAPALDPTEDGFLDLRGVVHVHTRDSHDSPGRMEDVVRGARRAGVSWVALTEHSEPGGPPFSGRADGVIVIPGYELRAWGGSLLAIGIAALPDGYADPARAIAAVRAAGGVAFVAHLEDSRIGPADWRAAGPDGLEISNLHAAARDAGYGSLALGAVLLPAPLLWRSLLRTPSANLARWDSLPDADAIVAGVDAHAKFRVLGPLGGTVDRYEQLFRLLTTHVLARAATREAILDALRAGRSYVAFEGRGRVDRFRFARRGAAFELEAPAPARLVLHCDAKRQERDGVARAALPIPAGATRCRGEAWRGDQVWVLTSYQRL
jgi:hypothetical protein